MSSLSNDSPSAHIRVTGGSKTGFHFGGFAKRTAELDEFITDFATRHGIDLDWVYVAKMMYGIFALVDREAFPAGTRIVAVITGGPFA